MKSLKRYFILPVVMIVSACSYFDTGERLEVSSRDLPAGYDAGDSIGEQSVESIIYRKTKGAVEIYSFDLSEEDAARGFAPMGNDNVQQPDSGGVAMSNGVEVFPIDVPMQDTLQPISSR